MRAVPFTDTDKAALPPTAEVIVMGPPPGWDGTECGTTEVVRVVEELHTGRPVVSHTTKWMPTTEDLARLNAGGSVAVVRPALGRHLWDQADEQEAA